MDSSDPLSIDAGGTERRTASSMLDSIARVRGALQDLAANEPGEPQADWSSAIAALGVLEQRSVLDPLAAPALPRRGLSGAFGQPFVAIVGVERFSGIREELGEPDADTVVAALCERIRTCAPSVHLGRINRSSIEFTFFAEGFDAAEKILARLQQRLHAPIPLADRSMALDVAIGFAGRGMEGDDLESLVDRAEHALAKARAGHVKLGAFTERDVAERNDRLALMRDLRTAVTSDEMFVCYQPKLNLRTSSITSAEALVRWRHPTRDLVAPDQFVPLAEEAGEIRPLTELVINHAVRAADALGRAGHALRLDLNISGRLVSDEDFARWALDALAGHRGRFGFEITETAVIANPDRALANIRAFSEAGVAIAIDDYGSGLSSLSYLKQIPAHELKIDRAFVSGLTSSHRDPLLVRSTIDLAHALDMEVTAEGVDNPMALALLRVMGCDMIQGYHVSRPLEIQDLLAFLEAFAAEDYLRSPVPVFVR